MRWTVCSRILSGNHCFAGTEIVPWIFCDHHEPVNEPETKCIFRDKESDICYWKPEKE